ncbi:MAG: CehA/McbA family metallohydrolase [Desulfurococcaceae archaeon]
MPQEEKIALGLLGLGIGVGTSSLVYSGVRTKLEKIIENTEDIKEVYSIYNPYAHGAKRYKGQLHCHTTNSDGTASPSQVVAKYRDELGFHFIVFTDHNYITNGTPYTVEGEFLAFSGVEDNGNWADHMIGVGDLTDYPSRTDPYDPPKRSFDMLRYRGIPQIAHPNWGNIDIMEMLAMVQPKLIEIYNYNTGGRLAEGLSLWDLLLRGGSLAWGVAVDDMHSLDQSGKGWIVVYADELTKPAVLNAIMRGAFYSTQGPELSFSVNGRTITCTCPTAVRIRAITANGLVADVKTSSLTYTLKLGDGYVRFEAQDEQGRWAWSNPFLDLATFPNLRITHRMIEDAIRYGATDGDSASGSTTSTSFVVLWQRATPKFELNIYSRQVFAGVENPAYARIRTSFIGSRAVDDALPLGENKVLIMEGELALVHSNKTYVAQYRTTDSAYSVTINYSVWYKRVFLPYLLPEDVIV